MDSESLLLYCIFILKKLEKNICAVEKLFMVVNSFYKLI